MGFFEDCSNVLIHQFQNQLGRGSLESEDNPARRLKFLEDCIRIVGVFERTRAVWKNVLGLEETLVAIRRGEKMLRVDDVNQDDVKLIMEELRRNTSLLGLSFGSNKIIGAEGAFHLSNMLRENSTILYLNINHNQIGPEGALYLSNMLRENSTLLFLDIYNNQICDEGALHLSNILRDNLTLLYLNINDNRIGAEGALHISDMLRVNSTLLYLDIEDNRIGAEGALHISDMLRENSTLLHLGIIYNLIGPNGALHLSNALRENSTLLSLPMIGNEIGPEGAIHLSSMLRENSSLLFLSVGSNQIDDEAVRHISNGLRQNSTLLYLYLRGNEIGPDGTLYLSSALRENSTLLYLNIGFCGIRDEGTLHLSKMLRDNSTLLYLGIKTNQIGAEGALHLSNMLRKNSTLLYLNIIGNQIGGEVEAEIENDLKSRQKESLSSKIRSFDQYASYLISLFGISSWTCVRGEYVSTEHDQLPCEIWTEIVSFLSDDESSLKESFLVPDLRSGFLNPLPSSCFRNRLSFSSRSVSLLSMIPLIEGHFRIDWWTIFRLVNLGLSHDYSEFWSGIISPCSSWMCRGGKLLGGGSDHRISGSSHKFSEPENCSSLTFPLL